MPAPLATQTRVLQPGDTWVYDVNGSTVGVSPAVTGSGTITITVSSKPLNGATVLAIDRTDHFVTSTGRTLDLVFTKYISQNSANRDILELGESSTGSSLQTVAVPQTIIFGSWTNGATLNPTLDFGGGDVETGPMQTITGSEVVQTPAGSFTAWKVTSPNSFSAGSNPIVFDWAPQLGAPVRYATFYGYSSPSGSADITATATLKSTTVPH